MVRWILLLVVAIVVAFFVYVGMHNTLPSNLGLVDGRLAPCPDTPNCVSSQSDIDDKEHYVEPIRYLGSRKDAQLAIEAYLLSKGNARIVKNSFGYVHFEVKSDLIGFIDDIEFYLPESDSVVQVRSASRVGYSDWGVNRERVRQIRDILVN